MTSENRWAKEAYPGQYKDDVERSIGFSGLDMDMFSRGKVDSMIDVLGVLSRVPAKEAECLDIGCGIGAMHPLMVNRVGSLSGTDVSSDAVAAAAAANEGVAYLPYDGSRLPYEDASFDFCSTVCVMHHVPPSQWANFVAEAFRVTRPDGLFAVYEHNPFNPLTRVAVWRCPFDHDAVLLKPRQVVAFMRAAGFEIVLKKYLFFTPIDAPWARRIDGKLGRLPLGAQYVVCGRRPAA